SEVVLRGSVCASEVVLIGSVQRRALFVCSKMLRVVEVMLVLSTFCKVCSP
ncbi:hypothetical protein A2U01_0095023, partial [Trifolium medium]|nr:hypothetical protein [Trifolium medium]